MATNLPAVAPSAIAAGIVAKEIAHLARRYGDENHRGQQPLAYHNATHSAGSVDAVSRIGERLVASGQLEAWDVHLLRIAAAFHDHEQDRGNGGNETASAQAAEEAMRAHPEIFSDRDIAKVRAAIMATRVEVIDGRLVQIVDSQDVFALALADADLAHLGMPGAVRTSLLLNEELQRRAGREIVDPDVTIEFLKFSAELMSYHEFHLPESREMFAAQQQANHLELVALVDEYSRGAMTFAQLQARGMNLASGTVLG